MGAVKNQDTNMWEAMYCTQDETGDWYVIPKSLQDSFTAYLDTGDMQDDFDLQDEFEEKFGKYRTGGDLNNVQLYIKYEAGE